MKIVWSRISNQWFDTKMALVVFATTATITAFGLAIGGPFLRSAPTFTSSTAQLFLIVAVVSWLFSAAITFAGMFRYWAVCDQSSPVRRTFWFVVLVLVGFLGFGLGPVIYCFVVYLPRRLKYWFNKHEKVGA
jgi:hypothetical protein